MFFRKRGKKLDLKVEPQKCILCAKPEAAYFFEDNSRKYFWCDFCDLVFVPPCQRLSSTEELKRYDLHRNNPDDKGYKTFLEKLFKPLNEKLTPGSCGLDFGSGPGPTLHRMFMDSGHKMNLYDCFYADDRSVLEQTYDFITATEVIEHLFNPRKELNHLWRFCLKPGGFLGVMTGFVKSKEAFKTWYYKNDPTHVAFYSKKTFEWLGKKWKASIEFSDDGVVIFRKPH